jgi:2-oxoglutarate ferredoxin oxidoreductase subunit gamma
MRMPTTAIYEQVTIAGFGGQGIMLAGKLLAQTAMQAGRQVTYMPSYGAEVRGGAANCSVVIADEPIASPAVSKPDSLIAMSKASLNKFGPCLKKGGLLIMNSSLIDSDPNIDSSIEIVKVPADQIAIELGNIKVANMVALGAYIAARGFLAPDAAADCLVDVLAERHHKTIPVNTEALRRGAEFVREHRR